MVLGRCVNKPLIVVDRGPWYRWALERLVLKYMYRTFGIRSAVERFFGYLEHRIGRFCDNINTWSIKSIEDYATAIIRNILTILKTHGGVLLG
jgi:transposase-like protein